MTDMGQLAACDSPEELTPEWLSSALAAAGFTVPVVGAEPTRVGTGQMGTSYRVQLRWSDPTAARAQGAPATVVAKMAAGPRESRGIISEGYRNEVGFYTELADTLAVRIPQCFFATITDDNTCFTLLLEDLAPAVPGDQATGLTAAARPSRRWCNLAGLHGPRWSDPTLLDVEWIGRQTAETAGFYADVLAGAIPTFLERFERWMAPEDPDTPWPPSPTTSAAWLTHPPRTLHPLHGDYRPDNLMFPQHGTGVSAVDWQTLALGLPGRDVGYLLATSLDPGCAGRRSAGSWRPTAPRWSSTAWRDLGRASASRTTGSAWCRAPLITVLGAVYATDPNPSVRRHVHRDDHPVAPGHPRSRPVLAAVGACRLFVKCCLNGARRAEAHPAVPRTPEQLAAAAATAVVAAGAPAIHMHPAATDGRREPRRLGHQPCGGGREGGLRGGVGVGVSTGAWFLPDPADRLPPSPGGPSPARLRLGQPPRGRRPRPRRALLDRGVGVEAGLWHAEAARTPPRQRPRTPLHPAADRAPRCRT